MHTMTCKIYIRAISNSGNETSGVIHTFRIGRDVHKVGLKIRKNYCSYIMTIKVELEPGLVFPFVSFPPCNPIQYTEFRGRRHFVSLRFHEMTVPDLWMSYIPGVFNSEYPVHPLRGV